MIIVTEKVCSICKEIKPIKFFTKQGKYYFSYCKYCRNEYNKKRYVKADPPIVNEIEGEIWLNVEGYVGKYLVSNLGRVKSIARLDDSGRGNLVPERILAQHKSICGYLLVHLVKNKQASGHSVHRLVAKSFIPNILNKEDVNHKDGNKENNNVQNLEWVTTGENQIHAYKLGLRVSKKGVKYGKRKLKSA